MALVALVVAANRRSDAQPTTNVVGSADMSQLYAGAYRSADDYYRQYEPFVAPVPLGDPVPVEGNRGHAAVLQADPGPGPAAFIVLVRNVGVTPIAISFSYGGARLDSDQGEKFYSPQVRRLSSGTVSPAAIGPRAEILLEIVFTVPARIRPARLILSLRLGLYQPHAQWDLPLHSSK